ncbi:leucine aminopeptidase-related [Holotrichia oblita]|nr:leucine aminopeptidase-related [Holotrichia oblita]
MMIEVLKDQSAGVPGDALILGLFEGMAPKAQIKELQAAAKTSDLDNLLVQIIGDLPNCAKFGETTVVHTYGMIEAKRIILAGLGKKKKLTIDRIRRISAVSTRTAQKLKSKTIITLIPKNIEEIDDLKTEPVIRALVEGTILGSYRFDYYKSNLKEDKDKDKEKDTEDTEDKEDKTIEIERLIILKDGKKGKKAAAAAAEEVSVAAAIKEGQIIAESVNYARDLTNHPAQYMTPSQLAFQAKEIAGEYGLSLTCLEKEEMQELKMNALLAVAKGSSEPPKLIALKYEGNPESKEVIAFVGKGITFDSGGISLKPASGMEDMIRDMAGAASVLGAMRAIAQLKPEVNVLGIMPCVENMPSGGAYRPGDIVTSMSGKTIEVISTDAEGRLILADAVTYAKKLGATRLVDLATLTGACVVALGAITSGVISNNKKWCDRVLKAAKTAGEKMWELPSDEEYLKQIKSKVADLKNTGGKGAGTITGGLFIGQFAGKTPWVHIDIAGTSDADKTEGYNYRGGTGVGVRTLVELTQDAALKEI